MESAMDLEKELMERSREAQDGRLIKRPSKEAGGLRGLLKGLDVDLTECEAVLGEASTKGNKAFKKAEEGEAVLYLQ